jgi:8-oxo-dGTP diphosphatase
LSDIARSLANIDWTAWSPRDVATLVFIVRGEEILLIRKKRGLGAGKINGPGGRLDPGETPLACAIREIQEELRATPLGLVQLGELRFQFAGGYSIHVHVFRADDCEGEPAETDEAIPLWTPVDRIPYDEMWADDRLWLPLVLGRQTFSGRFLFDGDAMLDHLVDRHPALEADGSGHLKSL